MDRTTERQYVCMYVKIYIKTLAWSTNRVDFHKGRRHLKIYKNYLQKRQIQVQIHAVYNNL